jgi:hypothetical protein
MQSMKRSVAMRTPKPGETPYVQHTSFGAPEKILSRLVEYYVAWSINMPGGRR